MNWINNFLNRVTMYWLVLNVLRGIIALATILSFFDILPFTWWHILAEMMFFIIACWISNYVLSLAFNVKPNYESQFITAEILTLIVGPINPLTGWVFLLLVSVVAMASKYLLAIKKRHIFNPAAFGLVVTALLMNQSASWWIGNVYLFPLTIIGGLLLNYKTRTLHLVWSFLLTYCVLFLAVNIQNGNDVLHAAINLKDVLLNSGLVFFATIMLTEPLTAPSNKNSRIIYGVFATVTLLVIQNYFTAIYYSLELSLLIANVLGFMLSPNLKTILKLKEKIYFAKNSMLLEFSPERKLNHMPGQYMQFTVPHGKADSRGTRRYFSIASSPTEDTLMLATKIAEKPSTYKQALQELKKDQTILANSLDGEFVLPIDPKEKLALVAGGVGITPFRSMIKYLLDKNEKRDIVLFYANNDPEDIGFTELFDEAEEKIALKTVYLLSGKVPANWMGKKGHLTPETISSTMPDYEHRIFYLSGPDPMVRAYKKMLRSMGIKGSKIKTDYFPGYE